MPERVYAYAKYNANGISALLCAACVTDEELEMVGNEPNGLEAIFAQGATRCDRCGKVA